MKKKSLWSFIIVFFFLGGIIFVLAGIDIYQKEVATESWPQTQGVVISSDISSRSSEDSTMYEAVINYQYKVNGINYTSNGVSYGDISSSDRNHAQNIVDKYYVGKIVTVYYNPINPSDAVLEPGPTWFTYILLLIGSLPLFISLTMLYFFIIRKKLKNIELTLEKTDFSPGDIVRGKVSINFNKPISTEALKIAFQGEKIIPRRGRDPSSSQTVYRDEILLDKQNEYFNNVYSFEIKIPDNILEKMNNWIDEQVPYEWAKKIYSASQNLGLMRAYDNYFIEVSLEIRGKIDIRNSIEIKIG